jgi:hypothetical protein
MRKNGEEYVVDFACAKSRHVYLYVGSHRLLHNLTDMCWKPSAGLGLRVAMVPESYQRIPILPGDGIQSSVVLDEAKLPILLDKDDWSS